jgi:hypothetical protein
MITSRLRMTRQVRDVLAQRASLLIGQARPLKLAGERSSDRRATVSARVGGRYVTIRVGGALGGVVMLSETAGDAVRVEASWGAGSPSERVFVTHESEREALSHANKLVETLIAGREPATSARQPRRRRNRGTRPASTKPSRR